MNSATMEPVPWNRRRWLYTISAAFLVQLALVFFLGDRPQEPSPPPRFRTAIYSATDPWSAQQLANLPTLGDPTLFALPNPRGFSGTAWLTFAPLEHRLTDWTEPPRWLVLDATGLGETFARLAATNVSAPLLIADKPLPKPTGLDLPIPNVPMATQSVLRVEGDLAQRPLLAPLPLCSWPSAEILTNTMVQVLVDAAGYTVSATLLSESGSRDADLYALKRATAARFRPLPRIDGLRPPDNRLTWGTLVFQWHTTALPTTNTAALTP